MVFCPRCASKLDTNNWKPLLAFHRRLIAGEVAPEPSTASVAAAVADTRSGAHRHVCPSDRSTGRHIHFHGVKAVCRQAKQRHVLVWNALAAIRQNALHTSLGLLINCP